MIKKINKILIASFVFVVLGSFYSSYSLALQRQQKSLTRIPIIKHVLSIPTFLKSFKSTTLNKPNSSPFVIPVPKKILVPHSIEQLQVIIRQAVIHKQKISLRGAGKSQGGQVSAEHALMIDMQKLDQIIALDIHNKTVTVQAGITWSKLQKTLNTYGLAIQAMQSYADFTVGGSLGVNAHGQDFHAGTVGDTVQSCTIINAQGELVTVSSHQEPLLFKLLIGGYGLFGIITQVTLKLTDNRVLKKQAQVLKTCDYPRYFLTYINNNKNVALHSARLSIAPHTLFDNVLSVTYIAQNTQQNSQQALETPGHILRDKLFFDMLRISTLAKDVRFPIEKYLEKQTEKKGFITRNNAMHATIAHLKNDIKNTRDILQEYFVPVAHINQFLSYLKRIVIENKINLLNTTIRFVKKIENSFLSYAPQDSFAIVLYINMKDTGLEYCATKKWTQQLINYVQTLGGTYYLPYQLFGSYDQVRKVYPQFDSFIQYKKMYDPEELFVNQFYVNYA